jgi:hypothetical protein
MLCLPYYAYVFSSIKLEIREEQVMPGSEERRGAPRGAAHKGEK